MFSVLISIESPRGRIQNALEIMSEIMTRGFINPPEARNSKHKDDRPTMYAVMLTAVRIGEAVVIIELVQQIPEVYSRWIISFFRESVAANVPFSRMSEQILCRIAMLESAKEYLPRA